jgi:hypothetical protein
VRQVLRASVDWVACRCKHSLTVHSLTVHSTLSYRKAVVRYDTRTMGKLGISHCGNFSTLQYAIVQESCSTRTLAYYSAQPRYCETMMQRVVIMERHKHMFCRKMVEHNIYGM